ncbi:hypothetical protein O181_112398 [Austropuccinia psidii MF-1]|uniref:Guanine nucleotide-binding protein subunit beta-like protein n=1 Tax=Austropuccinia psidii MF-1 TaxID=1389203 RepID=A0A9Q3K182_9BASI|nr:hypothetical protein [Austropuccinia psidii MF-1]
MIKPYWGCIIPLQSQLVWKWLSTFQITISDTTVGGTIVPIHNEHHPSITFRSHEGHRQNTLTTTQIDIAQKTCPNRCSSSVGNQQIVSGSRDPTIKLWNTLSECKFEIKDEGHNGWVSCVRFSLNPMNPVIVSAGWDKVAKVWELPQCNLRTEHHGHTGYLNTVTISPNGSLCASGGKDNITILWDLNEGKHLYSLEA